MQRRVIAVVAAVLVLAVAYFVPRLWVEERFAFTGATMGTTYSIKGGPFAATSDGTALQTLVDQRLDAILAVMSTYDPDSELSRLNRNPSTDWLDISPELHGLLAQALTLSERTGGAFDVTVGPLVNLWGFGPAMGEDDIPGDSEIAAAQARVGYQMIDLRADPPALKKAQGDIYIDLSAIAKGYAVDEIAKLLSEQGVLNYLVEIGGEMRALGINADGVPWRVALEQPVPGKRQVQTVLQLTSSGLASSGDYRNFFEVDGQRYAHIIDPASGRPTAHQLASVAVITPTCAEADALATALMVMGPERALAFAETENIPVYLITLDGDSYNVRYTDSFEMYLTE